MMIRRGLQQVMGVKHLNTMLRSSLNNNVRSLTVSSVRFNTQAALVSGKINNEEQLKRIDDFMEELKRLTKEAEQKVKAAAKEEEDPTQGGQRLPLEELKFFKLYPKEVQEWVLATRKQPGKYNDGGEWTETYNASAWKNFFSDLKQPNIFDKDEGFEKIYEDLKNRLQQRGLTEDEYAHLLHQMKSLFEEVTVPGYFKNNHEMLSVHHLNMAHQYFLTKRLSRVVKPSVKKMRDVPYDLQGEYRFGLTKSQVEKLPEKVKQLFSLEYASQEEITKLRKAKLISRWGLQPDDSGSSASQIACLTERIRNLSNHLKENPKDFSNAHGLRKMISRRFRIMKYMKRTEPEKYFEVLKELGLRDPVKITMYPVRTFAGRRGGKQSNN